MPGPAPAPFFDGPEAGRARAWHLQERNVA
jgi:hypothetical protein